MTETEVVIPDPAELAQIANNYARPVMLDYVVESMRKAAAKGSLSYDIDAFRLNNAERGKLHNAGYRITRSYSEANGMGLCDIISWEHHNGDDS